ncbi:FAD-binding oxidoreductase [Corynebacterium sputi]|uniref:FAD-binding oxidoreductase n=1 Tax=Corynebacterium sputi TaxID=489915 RepID=UPI00041F9F94|nr:FAD-binding oxidoreductase [Corynebacterium sputi]
MSLKEQVVRIAGKFTDSVRIGNGLEQRDLSPVGWWAHDQAVQRLKDSFEAVPTGERVRLAKKTSNLFRGRDTESAGLDASGLGGVVAVDPVENTADVQGMCTYEDLVDVLLPHGLAPTVTPQLKTITLGGAVTGMGVESSSFRNGLPHEAVLEMDVLTGTGEVVTCSPTQNLDLYRGFPNSYGSLGYAVRIKVRVEKVMPFVELRHVRFGDVGKLTEVLALIAEGKAYDGERVDYLDGVVFSLDECYLVLGKGTDETGPVSDYTRDQSYYRSIQHPDGILRDRLTIRDYLWRWDIDWFWCNRAFGAQNPTVRALWPRDLLRSSFYWKIIGWDRKFDIADRLEARAGRPARERVVQDIEVTPQNLPEFLTWFFTTCEIQPVWLCPIRLADGVELLAGTTEVLDSQEATKNPWPLYPLTPGDTWVNVGFWSSVPVDLMGADAPEGAFNREIEEVVSGLGGHKSLYSEAFYSPEKFAELYGGDLPQKLKSVYDPDGRFPGLYEKTVKWH